MKITAITAVPLSYRLPEGKTVTMGVGSTTKRDAIIVRVETSEGITGYGEAHPGRSPGAVASAIHGTLAPMLSGWTRPTSSAPGSGCTACSSPATAWARAARWRCRASTWPCGTSAARRRDAAVQAAGRPAPCRPMPAASRWATRHESLAEEAKEYVARGYKAVKLRIGDTAKNDIERVSPVREALGDDVDILTDANTTYTWPTRAA